MPKPEPLHAGVSRLAWTNVQRFRGGLVFKAQRPLYHSTLGLRVIKKKQKTRLDGDREGFVVRTDHPLQNGRLTKNLGQVFVILAKFS